jgi:hypothetical protein
VNVNLEVKLDNTVEHKGHAILILSSSRHTHTIKLSLDPSTVR